MGYENPIPPVPTRDQEKQMITALKKSFQDQKNTKLYMNESVRLRKMEKAEQRNLYRLNFWRNFNRGALFSFFPAILTALSLRRTAGFVPKYFYGKHYTGKIFNNYHTFRNLHILGGFAPLWIGLSYGYACYFTDIEIVTSEYEKESSVVLPY